MLQGILLNTSWSNNDFEGLTVLYCIDEHPVSIYTRISEIINESRQVNKINGPTFYSSEISLDLSPLTLG